jgi:hypothetical protein
MRSRSNKSIFFLNSKKKKDIKNTTFSLGSLSSFFQKKEKAGGVRSLFFFLKRTINQSFDFFIQENIPFV